MMKKQLALLLPSCRDATRLASAALDRPLSARERFSLRLHLLVCGICRRYQKQINFLHEILHHHPEILSRPAATQLSPAARDRIRRALESTI
ncbi:MAG: zf-HC2 domain-containing protein [Verrucomicrobiota bacterium]